jgi:tripartite-type tricarboxylate transporter receptor subunit TctC
MKKCALQMIVFVLTIAVVMTSISLAEDKYPSKPIIVIAGAGVGGANDTFARVLASFSADFLDGQPMVVVNKPGGAQVPAMKFTRAARPDGYTLQSISAGSAALATMMRDQGVSYPDDFEIIAEYGRVSPALFVKKDGPYSSVQDVMDAAKKNPGKLRWGHSGRGTSVHVACLGWAQANDLKMRDVPFKGGSQSRAALISGDIDLVSTGAQQLAGFEEKVKILAVFAGTRDPLLNKFPTMKELGIAYVDVYSPMMVIAPKGTSEEKLNYLEDKIGKIATSKGFVKMAKKAGISVTFKNRQEAKTNIETLIKGWQPIVDSIKGSKK